MTPRPLPDQGAPSSPYQGPLLVPTPAEIAWIHEHAACAPSDDTTGRTLAAKTAAALNADPKWRLPLGPA